MHLHQSRVDRYLYHYLLGRCYFRKMSIWVIWHLHIVSGHSPFSLATAPPRYN